jgi:hypothetical protein
MKRFTTAVAKLLVKSTVCANVCVCVLSCMLFHCRARKIEKSLRGGCVQFNKLLSL